MLKLATVDLAHWLLSIPVQLQHRFITILPVACYITIAETQLIRTVMFSGINFIFHYSVFVGVFFPPVFSSLTYSRQSESLHKGEGFCVSIDKPSNTESAPVEMVHSFNLLGLMGKWLRTS